MVRRRKHQNGKKYYLDNTFALFFKETSLSKSDFELQKNSIDLYDISSYKVVLKPKNCYFKNFFIYLLKHFSMKIAIKIGYVFVFLILSKFSYSQEPKITDEIEDKVVIGFPGITPTQLTQIQGKFLTYDQILTAKFIEGNHNCMLITFDPNGTDFSVYGEVLKNINQFYDTDNCYFKVKPAFAEILANIGNATVFDLK